MMHLLNFTVFIAPAGFLKTNLSKQKFVEDVVGIL